MKCCLTDSKSCHRCLVGAHRRSAGMLCMQAVSSCALQSGSQQVCNSLRQSADVPCTHAVRVSRCAMHACRQSAGMPCNHAGSRCAMHSGSQPVSYASRQPANDAMQVGNDQACYASRQAAGLPMEARLPTCRPHLSMQPVLRPLTFSFMRCRMKQWPVAVNIGHMLY